MSRSEAETSVEVDEHLTLFVDDHDALCGWQLAQPEAFLAAGFEPCPTATRDGTLADKFVAYLVLAHDEDFIDQLVDDEAARGAV